MSERPISRAVTEYKRVTGDAGITDPEALVHFVDSGPYIGEVRDHALHEAKRQRAIGYRDDVVTDQTAIRRADYERRQAVEELQYPDPADRQERARQRALEMQARAREHQEQLQRLQKEMEEKRREKEKAAGQKGVQVRTGEKTKLQPPEQTIIAPPQYPELLHQGPKPQVIMTQDGEWVRPDYAQQIGQTTNSLPYEQIVQGQLPDGDHVVATDHGGNPVTIETWRNGRPVLRARRNICGSPLVPEWVTEEVPPDEGQRDSLWYGKY